MAKYLDMNGVSYLLVRVREIMEEVASGGIDLTDYVTRTQLQKELASLNIDIDLSNYVTNEQLTTALQSYVKPSALAAYVKTSTLASYVKAEELEDYVHSSALEGLATTDYVTNAINNAQLGGGDGNSVDLSIYATTNAMNTALSNKADKNHVHTEYATKEYVDESLTEVNVDLSNYYTKTQTHAAINASIPDLSDFATESFVNEKIETVENAINNIEVSGAEVYYGVSQPSDGQEIWINPDGVTNEYATIEYVDNAISNIDTSEVNLSGYAKTVDVNTALAKKANIVHTHDEYLTEIPDLSNYALKEDIPDTSDFSLKEHTHSQYLTSHQDISGKADVGHKHVLADITNYSAPNLTNYATKTYVQEQIDAIEITGGGGVGESGIGQNSEVFNDYTGNKASGIYSHAEGKGTEASGTFSHAEGTGSEATGSLGAHAEGNDTEASGNSSHAEGTYTKAIGQGSHAEGFRSESKGMYSHAEGEGTIAGSNHQHVQGKYNVEDTAGTYAHIVGNGTLPSNPLNIHTLDWDGNAWFKGKVYVGGTSMSDAVELGAGGSGTGTVDLSNYYTRTQVDALIPDVSGYTTVQQVETMISDQEHLTEDMILALLDEKLGVIENGTY